MLVAVVLFAGRWPASSSSRRKRRRRTAPRRPRRTARRPVSRRPRPSRRRPRRPGRAEARRRATRLRARRCSRPRGAAAATLEAGSSGSVGPNLDESKPSYDLVVERVTNGQGAMRVQGQLERAADQGRRRVRRRRHAGVTAPRYPVPRPERCPSSRRSATGNRVRVERRVAGSNPALSADGCSRPSRRRSRGPGSWLTLAEPGGSRGSLSSAARLPDA